MRVATYARSSTNRQELSVPDQQDSTRRHARKNLDWRIVAEFEDVKSGRYAKSRKGFQELRRRIKNNEFDVVLIDELTRLSRKFQHILAFHALCKQHKVVIISVTKGELNHILLMALGIAAQLQLETGSEQVMRALRGKLHRGLRSSSVPYGYRADTRNGEKGHLAVDREQARQVVRIFKWAASGMSLLDICGILNAEGIPAPRSATWKARILSRVVWSTDRSSSFRAGILHNPTYCGENIGNRIHQEADAETEDFRLEIRDERDWIREPGAHKKIILKNLFDRVQAVRLASSNRARPAASGKKSLLSDKIFCVHCNGTMIRSGSDKGRRQRLRCRNSIFNEVAEPCRNTKSHYADVVDRAVVLAVVTFLSRHEDAFTSYLNAHNTARASEAAKAERKVRTYRSDVERLNKQIDNLVNALANSGDHETLNPKIADLKKQRAAAELLHKDAPSAGYLFKIDKVSIEGYERTLRSLLDRLNRADAIDMQNDGLVARFRALIDKVVLHSAPKHKRGFRAEIFSRVGDLVAIDAGQNLQSNDTFQMESVVALQEWARANLIVEIPPLSSEELLSLEIREREKIEIEPAIEALKQILNECFYPILTSELIPRLKSKGIDLSARPGSTSVKHVVSRSPDIINLNGSGYWLRQRPCPSIGYDPQKPGVYDRPLTSKLMNLKKLPHEDEAVKYLKATFSLAGRPLNCGDISFVLSLCEEFHSFSHPLYGVKALINRNRNIFYSVSTNVYWLKNVPLISQSDSHPRHRSIKNSGVVQFVRDEISQPLTKYEILDLLEARGFEQSWGNVSSQLANFLLDQGFIFVKDRGWWPSDRSLPEYLSISKP